MFVPQIEDIHYYSLQTKPSSNYYLQFSCSAEYTGSIQIKFNYDEVHDELHILEIPVSSSLEDYVYTIPLKYGILYSLKFIANGNVKISKLVITDGSNVILKTIELKRYAKGSNLCIKNVTDNLIQFSPGNKYGICSLLYVFNNPLINADLNKYNFSSVIISVLYLSLSIFIITFFILNCNKDHTRKKLPKILNIIYYSFLIAIIGNRYLIFEFMYELFKYKTCTNE